MNVEKQQAWRREAEESHCSMCDWSQRFVEVFDELWDGYVTQKLWSMEAEAGFNEFILEMTRKTVEDTREACLRAWAAGYDARGVELGRGGKVNNPYVEKHAK